MPLEHHVPRAIQGRDAAETALCKDGQPRSSRSPVVDTPTEEDVLPQYCNYNFGPAARCFLRQAGAPATPLLPQALACARKIRTWRCSAWLPTQCDKAARSSRSYLLEPLEALLQNSVKNSERFSQSLEGAFPNVQMMGH